MRTMSYGVTPNQRIYYNLYEDCLGPDVSLYHTQVTCILLSSVPTTPQHDICGTAQTPTVSLSKPLSSSAHPLGFIRGIRRVWIWYTVPIPVDTVPFTGKGTYHTLNNHSVTCIFTYCTLHGGDYMYVKCIKSRYKSITSEWAYACSLLTL